MKVVVRVRPLLEDEIAAGKRQLRLQLDDLGKSGSYRSVVLSPAPTGTYSLSATTSARIFKFDKVFGPKTTQEKLYREIGGDLLVNKVLSVSDAVWQL